MASYPPPGTPPPGNYPPPGYDPRAQRRYWRDQQRAQRDAMRAQAAQVRYQMRAMRRGSILAPLVLISIGILFLLLQTGRIDHQHFWNWYSHWWPLLLVVAGLVVLAEWMLDQYHMRDPSAPQYRRSFGGGVGLLVFVLIVSGVVAANARRGFGVPWMFNGMRMDPDSLDELLGDKHESDQATDAAFPEGSTLTVVNPRGDISISGTSDDGRLHISVHKQVFARSDSDAESRAQQLTPQIQQPAFAGMGSVNVTLPALDGARADLVITVPASAAINVRADRGDIHVGSIRAEVTATANNGDLELLGITGQTTARINNGRSSLTAHSIEGGLSVQGRAQDLTLADITGPVTMNGNFYGTTHLAHINGAVHFHTGRADFQLVRLDGQAEIQHDSDVSADQALGPLILNTRNGNVTLDRVAGDVTVTNSNGAIDLTAAPALGNIVLEDRSGSIRATLPSGSSFTIDAATTDGNVQSDFPLPAIETDNHKSLKGAVGEGGPTVRLVTREGDITLRKADVQPLPATAPSPPRITMAPQKTEKQAKSPKAPKAPAPPSAPSAPAPPSPGGSQ